MNCKIREIDLTILGGEVDYVRGNLDRVRNLEQLLADVLSCEESSQSARNVLETGLQIDLVNLAHLFQSNR